MNDLADRIRTLAQEAEEEGRPMVAKTLFALAAATRLNLEADFADFSHHHSIALRAALEVPS